MTRGCIQSVNSQRQYTCNIAECRNYRFKNLYFMYSMKVAYDVIATYT